MLKISAEPTFRHTVHIFVPVDGGHREDTCDATFRVIPTNKVATYDLTKDKGTGEFLTAAIVRLDELADEQGKPILYSDALRDQLIVIPYVRLGLMRAYLDGVSKARAGN